jgi:hypothetical protein
VAAVTDRRIEIVIEGKKAPGVVSAPTLSSAATGWHGFLLEEHSSKTPLLVEAAQRLSYFSFITTVGTPQSITAQELRIECMFPLEPESK